MYHRPSGSRSKAAAPTIVSAKIEGRLSAGHRDGMAVLMIVAIDELMLSVRTESPFKTIEEFVKAAKDRPSQLNVCGTGTNSEDHIFAYLFEKAASIKFKYVLSFYWEQMRGVVGTAGMPPEAVKFWTDTLKKVVATKEWREGYIKRNLLTPVEWVGEEGAAYLDSLRGKYEKALGDLGALKK